MAKRNKINAIDLSKALNAVLTEYGNDVYKVLDGAVIDVSEKAAQKLRGVTSWKNSKPSSDYSKSWTVGEERAGRLGVKLIVYNDGHARLTHLLEKGHVSRNGTGRTFGRVQAYPHIAPVNEWVVDELQKEVERRIQSL